MGFRQAGKTLDPGIGLVDQQSLSVEASRLAFVALRDRAYRLLARREYSRFELRQKLQAHDSHDQIERVLEQLADEGSQSDLRFAEQLASTRINSGKGPRLLEQELGQHRLDNDIVQDIMDRYRNDWGNRAESVRRKKFGASEPSDYREWTRQARFLQQRGFTSEQIGTFRGD